MSIGLSAENERFVAEMIPADELFTRIDATQLGT